MVSQLLAPALSGFLERDAHVKPSLHLQTGPTLTLLGTSADASLCGIRTRVRSSPCGARWCRDGVRRGAMAWRPHTRPPFLRRRRRLGMAPFPTATVRWTGVPRLARAMMISSWPSAMPPRGTPWPCPLGAWRWSWSGRTSQGSRTARRRRPAAAVSIGHRPGALSLPTPGLTSPWCLMVAAADWPMRLANEASLPALRPATRGVG